MSHEKEVQNVERAQKKQFIGFEVSWDSYMMEYEQGAQRSIKNVQRQQAKDVKSFIKMMDNNPNFKIVFSQDLILLRNRISKLISVGNYDEADQLKDKADQLEKVEYSKAAIESEMDVDKEKQKIILAQEKTLNTILRRIERDRREQMKHRQEDTQRLILRNKNLVTDIYNRQNQEKRKTKQFLTWVLSDIHTFGQLKPTKHSNSHAIYDKTNQRRNQNRMRDVKISPKLAGSKTHQVKKNMKLVKSLMERKESVPNTKNNAYKSNKTPGLMVLRNSKNFRNRSLASLKNNDGRSHSLINITKHKAGYKQVKKNRNNMSYNSAYGIMNELPGEPYSTRVY
jgi:hypothetical protein